MFDNIRRDYKKSLKETKFSKLYWLFSIISMAVSYGIVWLFNLPKYFMLIFIILCIITITFYLLYSDYKKVIKTINTNDIKKLKNKFDAYRNKNYYLRIDNLISILSSNNCTGKNDLMLLINSYNGKQPITIKPNIAEWIISTIVTLASFAAIAYNDLTGKIDYNKLSTILGSTFSFVLYMLIIISIIRFIINSIFIPNNEIYSWLRDDISYIYVNYGKYKNRLYQK